MIQLSGKTNNTVQRAGGDDEIPQLFLTNAVYSWDRNSSTRVISYLANAATTVTATIILQGWVWWPAGIMDGQCGNEAYFVWQENTQAFSFNVPYRPIWNCPYAQVVTHKTKAYAGFYIGTPEVRCLTDEKVSTDQ